MKSRHFIREARLRAGLTQRQLAERAGTTQSSIARWETGGVAPPLETLARLAAACGLELTARLREPDAGERSLIERNLALDPEQRFDQLVRTVAFIRDAREAMGRRHD